MKTFSLSGTLREGVGKKDAKKHRKEGKIPCVLYGGKEQVHFTLENLAFDKLIFTPEVYLIILTIDGTEYNAILQDIQYHPVTDKVLHADFLQTIDGKPITIGLPVKFEGDVPGVIAGGRLVKSLRKVLIKGLPADLPDYIMINMSELNIGDSITIGELQSDKFELLETPNTVVVIVKTARGVADDELEDEDEEGGEGEEGEGTATEE